jgi:hypothetical protein
MSQLAAELKDERKNRRKGATYSIILHALLLLIAIWPFLEGPADIDKNFAIVVEFEKPIVVKKSGSSQKQSAASSSSEQANKPSETEPAPKRNVQEVERIEKTDIRPATQPIEEVITAPDIEVPKWPEPVETPERIETTTPTKQTTPQTVEDNSIDDFLPVLDKIIEEDEAGAGSTAGELGDSNFDPNADGGSGSGGDGKGEKDNGGVAAGAGTGSSDLPPGDFGSGEGLGGAGFDGEGPLTRQIKKRADCTHLVYQDAKIVLDLCINRSGDITYSRYNMRRSSVKDKSYARQFTNCFRNTIFFPDNSAPAKECGTYTYKISFN